MRVKCKMGADKSRMRETITGARNRMAVSSKFIIFENQQI
jgi:hypothetical protein